MRAEPELVDAHRLCALVDRAAGTRGAGPAGGIVACGAGPVGGGRPCTTPRMTGCTRRSRGTAGTPGRTGHQRRPAGTARAATGQSGRLRRPTPPGPGRTGLVPGDDQATDVPLC